jgi:hypothetical protein
MRKAKCKQKKRARYPRHEEPAAETAERRITVAKIATDKTESGPSLQARQNKSVPTAKSRGSMDTKHDDGPHI